MDVVINGNRITLTKDIGNFHPYSITLNSVIIGSWNDVADSLQCFITCANKIKNLFANDLVIISMVRTFDIIESEDN